MAQYLLLYRGRKLPQDHLGKRELVAELDRWGREISNVLIDGGNPIESGRTITIAEVGSLKDKPITSYCVIEAEDMDEAVELSRSAPSLHDDGGSADIYEIVTG